MEDCVFCKIVRGEIPTEVVYKDSEVLGFKDIHPKAPLHLVFIPKKHIIDLLDLNDEIFIAIKNKILDQVKKSGLMEKGYRLVINGGAAKAIPHLHVHLLGEVGVERQV